MELGQGRDVRLPPPSPTVPGVLDRRGEGVTVLGEVGETLGEPEVEGEGETVGVSVSPMGVLEGVLVGALGEGEEDSWDPRGERVPPPN